MIVISYISLYLTPVDGQYDRNVLTGLIIFVMAEANTFISF